MQITLGISLTGTRGFAPSPYAVAGFTPDLVTAFTDEKYRTNGSATDFDGAITHTRASTATYVDSSGILQTAASGVPRVGHHIYDGSQWVNEGILHESEARTNLVLHSGDFSDKTNWSSFPNETVRTSWLGTSYTAVELRTNIGSGGGAILQAFGTFSGGPEVVSVIVEEVDSPRVGFGLLSGSNGWQPLANFDPSTGAQIGGINEDQVFSEYLGIGPNGGKLWLFATMSLSTPSGDTRQVYVYPSGSSSSNDGTATILHHVQVEEASAPSSHIPTAGSQVTRAADSMTIPAAKLPYDATNMSIAMEGRMTYADEGNSLEVVVLRWSNASTGVIRLYISGAGISDQTFVFNQSDDLGVADFVAAPSNTTPEGINVPFSIAGRHGSTFLNGAVDGTALTEDTTPTALPDLSTTDLSLGDDFMGTIRLFRMWDDDLGDSGLESASSLATFSTEFTEEFD